MELFSRVGWESLSLIKCTIGGQNVREIGYVGCGGCVVRRCRLFSLRIARMIAPAEHILTSSRLFRAESLRMSVA